MVSLSFLSCANSTGKVIHTFITIVGIFLAIYKPLCTLINTVTVMILSIPLDSFFKASG